MSALAEILLSQGEAVSGSDQKESLVTKRLASKGAHITYPQGQAVLKESDCVVYSTAIKRDNPEFLEAKEKGCQIKHRSELLEHLLASKEALVVTGAHGKTTTTALLAHTLMVGGKDPSYVIGGFSPSLESNGRRGLGPYFVAEGDESDGSFLRGAPKGAIITNIDDDHLDYWKTSDALQEAYKTFITKIEKPSLFFYHGEDPHLSSWALKGEAYGLSEKYPLYASDLSYEGATTSFTVHNKKEKPARVKLNLAGQHNVLNALGVFGLTRALGLSVEEIKRAFLTFGGVGRRLEYKGEREGAIIYDDYAHHPKEVEATLLALKEIVKDRRCVVVFQPHRYSRLRDFMDSFTHALQEEKNLIVTDVYSAGEKEIPGVNTLALLERLPKSSRYVPRDSLTEFLKGFIQKNDCVITLGAGDITHVSTELSRC
jgi:UDP-N-acetylmuramate--alanine ligase